MKWMAFDRYDGDYEFFKTEAEAREDANKMLDQYRDEAHGSGWAIEPGDVGYCKVIAHCVQTDIAYKKDFTDDEWEAEGYSLGSYYISDFHLQSIKGYGGDNG
jgi:hypothetical protein